MKKNETNQSVAERVPVITKIVVENFKSIMSRQVVDIRPLTVFAGANSSGKSSIMQAVLLLKQTLEASYDPGPLLIDGPNVAFTSADQLLSRLDANNRADHFVVGIKTDNGMLESSFRRIPGEIGFYVEHPGFGSKGQPIHENMTPEQIAALASEFKVFETFKSDDPWTVTRNRFLLQLTRASGRIQISFVSSETAKLISGIIHLPGLRGNPSRTYPVTAAGPNFPGTFEKYTASVISLWQTQKKTEKLEGLNHDLEYLGLTCRVKANVVNTQVELLVGRLPHAAADDDGDLVNIADVGFGVSQTLPVLVALHAAEPQHLVYLEQPEIHLHPRAQYRLASVIAAAAKRGVRVVVETHSSIFLLGLQTLVAKGELASEIVKLHWFARQNDGSTQITPANLDEAGAFGKWPEDFAEINLEAESAYLDAAEPHMSQKVAKK